jgi:hypothetical protein
MMRKSAAFVKKDVPAETNTHVIIGHPVPGGYRYEDLALQVGRVSTLRQ